MPKDNTASNNDPKNRPDFEKILHEHTTRLTRHVAETTIELNERLGHGHASAALMLMAFTYTLGNLKNAYEKTYGDYPEADNVLGAIPEILELPQ